jgi:ankyrin repeat protein
VEEGKADVDKVNDNNQTPINMAAYTGHLEVVQFLLGKGADCTIEDAWGDTPLGAAKAGGHAEVAAALAGN